MEGVPDDATDALAMAIGCAYRGVHGSWRKPRMIGSLRGPVTHVGEDP